jgi:hypothetical protein
LSLVNERPIPIKVGDTTLLFTYSEEDHALFMALGATIAQIQSFETSISGFLSGIDSQNKGKNFDGLMNQYINKTLGAMIKFFNESVSNLPIAERLESVRTKRNYVAHNILRFYGWPLMSSEKYLQAIKELDNIRETIMETEYVLAKHIQDNNLLSLLIITINDEIDERDAE